MSSKTVAKQSRCDHWIGVALGNRAGCLTCHPHLLQLFWHFPFKKGAVLLDRELEILVERAVIVCGGPVLYLDPFAETGSEAGDASPLKLHDVIRSHLVRAIKLSSGKIYGQDGAARLLGLKPSTLQAKLKRYGIDRLKVFQLDQTR